MEKILTNSEKGFLFCLFVLFLAFFFIPLFA